MGTIRTLVLSGGGGRGAFHAGVYSYLSQKDKKGVDDEHKACWAPDIVVGTSIGAVNGAAIVQGIEADELLAFWRSLRERDIEGLPPNMTRFARWVINQVFKNLIGVSLSPVHPDDATSPKPEQSWLPLPGLGKFGAACLGRWNNLLDTGPLQKTITQRLGLDPKKIEQSASTLLINATHVSTGQRVTFSNRPIYRRNSAELRPDVQPGITIPRILASCSIPLVYPWTFDEITRSVYWDGAVVANTPLGVSLDAANAWPNEDRMEAVVVLMTPWKEGSPVNQSDQEHLPKDFTEAITWMLDWFLLASFRERLDLINAYNRLREIGQETNNPELASIRQVDVVIVAPEDFFPAVRIIDYDEYTDQLIEFGRQAAARAFTQSFPG